MSLIYCLFGLQLCNGQSTTSKSVERPNIIFLMTDDQRWDNMGCYGKPEFYTPNINKLSKEGITFDNAYYAVAICMPSRVTMMTGRYNSNHRVGFVAPDDYTLSQADFAKGYPAILKKAGYRTGFVGKVGFTVTKETQRPSTPKEHFYKENLGSTFDFFAGSETQPQKGLELWPENDLALQEIYREGRTNTGRTLKTGEAMLRFLETQPDNQPFCLSVSFYAVKHDSDKHMYMPHYEQFKNKDFTVAENWVEGDNEELPKVVKENARGVYLHRQRSSKPEQYQRLVRRFATQGYTVDEQVGKLIEKLKEKGILENTIIIYTSDNGRFQGSHGLFDKCLLYDEAVKAPLIIYDGRKSATERSRREDALVSSVDMAPTIVSLAGLEIPKSMQGRDITGVLNKTQDMSQWRDAVFMEDLFLVDMFKAKYNPKADEINQKLIEENKSYRARGVRTKKWKYFVYYEHNPRIEELYDVANDPLEQNNLVHSVEHTQVLKELRKKTEELYKKAVQ
ncbi:mucin-desulfating sulfatase (N-acetylglucosamine-6-sulfatase) [Wenyingzhuangia fucanilytica]|uniref:Mucin-desulfating sulfatase (N-acetylglucosamine-6-sulfatase) n=1 Tax=Wenyingzhuangia fucanilytica TaxID=1790137 RepID=A0A1B1Y9H1_9FLAO|nr:sulfatase-like hydrolase/transferase [Wenyingzhuangia fucanilytica]ANW97422.1 mucin-desulfating sulfatase (N-acetylglucosamine-6-sulfatase) [Wenyingzhuangia fucanilytica]